MCATMKAMIAPGITPACNAKNRVSVWWPYSVPPTTSFCSAGPTTGVMAAMLVATFVAQKPFWSHGSR